MNNILTPVNKHIIVYKYRILYKFNKKVTLIEKIPHIWGYRYIEAVGKHRPI